MALYAVLKEVATNDLKYGRGKPVWSLDWDDTGLKVDFQSRSDYRLSSHGTGRGTASMLRRLSEIDGTLHMSMGPAPEKEEEPPVIEIEIRAQLNHAFMRLHYGATAV